MKLKDFIINENLIDSKFDIERAVLNKSNSTVNIFIKIENVLSYEGYVSLENKVKDFFDKMRLTSKLNVNYSNNDFTGKLEAYLDAIVKDITRRAPRFHILKLDETIIEGNSVAFKVPYDSLGVEDLCEPVVKEFTKYGLNVNVKIERVQGQSVEAELADLQRKIDETVSKQRQEAEAINKANEKMKIEKKNYRADYGSQPTSFIKDIPSTQNEIAIYENTNGPATFSLSAYVFGFELKSFPKTKSKLAQFKVTDNTDSIIVKKWVRTEGEAEIIENQYGVNGAHLKIFGKAEYDMYAKQVVIMSNKIELLGMQSKDTIMDDAEKKRVELHAHTKMSTLDGMADASEYIKLVNSWGWKAMAFTDHGGVYCNADIAHEVDAKPDKYKDFKPIYGVELSYINDDEYFITFDKRDIPLKDASYVVFDIETTGLSQSYDEIIEIAACKVYQGGIVDTFETFVNPRMPIPAKITELTSIDDEMVKDALTIDEVLPKFMEFCEGSIMVAHNAKFDVGMIYKDIKKLGLNYEQYPVIDTLNLFRAGYHTEVKYFNLAQLSKYFKVKQEHHHRAIDDTRVTALCFISMLNDLFKKGIYNYQDINSLIDPNVHWKYVIPAHITLLAKNPVGFKNMYKIVSDSLTNHFADSARVLKSTIEQYKEGLLIGSACVNGNVFELALRRSKAELIEEMKYYDYIEVQPPTAYRQLFNDMPNGETVIKDTIVKIINTAKSLGKVVVATSDCHYLRPDSKQYRDILIASPQIGGGRHPLDRYDQAPDMHLRTTNEMLDEFVFLGKDLAYEIVVKNTNLIADMVEKFPVFKPDTFAPSDDEFKDTFLHVDSIVEEVRRVVKSNTVRLYGENPHQIVQKRVDRELNSIISNGYSSVYYMSHLLVVKSLSDGYLVGSRGSVGSSLVATLMDITEINPLAPHYRCKKCKFHTFKMNEEELKTYGVSDVEAPFQKDLQSVDSGYDLPNAICPICGEPLAKDGHDIPFETFLGFNGDKVPDIDLNFSGEYQAQAHEYIRTVFGPDNAFRAGTIGTIAENTAYGYVKGYCERKGIQLRDCEMERLATHLVGIRRSTGQHPGGIIVVPHRVDIYDVTPVQYPADNTDATWRTTHYDYHSFEHNLLKLDILGHDDPTIIKFFMDYVKEHPEQFPFDNPQDIPIDDPNVYKLFSETEVLGFKESDINSKVASFAVPEFGTNFVRKMLVETLPKTFAQLVKISGLSHGTDVWTTNAQDLVGGVTEFGAIPFKDIIGCRDDIMVDLMYDGLDPSMAFKIMEFVRKGKAGKDPAGWAKFKTEMEAKNVPAWYIWSCERIKYMFPKAHATAYVLMALRVAWFKVNAPKLFYSGWFSKRAAAHHVQAYLGGKMAIKAAMEEIENLPKRTATDDDKYTALQVALEMTLRGIKFLPVDINKSSATIFEIEEGGLRIPFAAVQSLGPNIAYDIVEKRNEKPFSSKKDVMKRTRLNQTLFEVFDVMHAFGDLPDEDLEESEGLFAFA